MSFKQEGLDPFDLVDFEQAVYPSPSASSSSSSLRGKSIATPEFSIANTNNVLLPPRQTSQQSVHSGPSHQYDLYKQQTGLPLGALANTLAANQPNTFAYSGLQQQGYVIPPSDGYFGGMNSGISDDIFDFNSMPSHNPSFSSSTDMDMDFDSPISDLFTPALKTLNSDFVDPHAIGGQEDVSPASTPVQTTSVRPWPGMHQQQAQAALAAKAAQQQQLQQRQQQQQTRPAQPTQAPAQVPKQPAHRSTSSTSRPAADPIVEERISRLLSQMRQSSVASSHDEASTPHANQQSHLARQRKEEEDMDEDERLLASEEGKKLSSKERRQLRNKVSARAFRSRRKEYIGQLEGELAAKSKEGDDLHAENEALKAENTRLTDLTRMLLSSTAFSSFLNDLSNNGVPNMPATASSTLSQPVSVTQQPQQSTPVRKDANPHQRQSQSLGNSQVGMTLVPDTAMDFSAFDPNSNAWANMDYGFNHAQVFAVTELPQGPAVDRIDTGILSGKSSNSVGSYSSDEAKDNLPTIERMPFSPEKVKVSQETIASDDEVEMDESNPAFALFVDYPTVSKPIEIEPEHRLFGTIRPEKAFARLEIVIDEESSEDDVVSSAVMARFERICSDIEASSSRLAAITYHL